MNRKQTDLGAKVGQLLSILVYWVLIAVSPFIILTAIVDREWTTAALGLVVIVLALIGLALERLIDEIRRQRH